MFDAKRIEIVIPEYCLPDLLECVERHGVDGYTLFRGLSGRGGRGLQSGDGISASSSNALVLLACDPALERALLESLSPLLERHGGLCLVLPAKALRRLRSARGPTPP
jgi:hypothetical protein